MEGIYRNTKIKKIIRKNREGHLTWVHGVSNELREELIRELFKGEFDNINLNKTSKTEKIANKKKKEIKLRLLKLYQELPLEIKQVSEKINLEFQKGVN
jgi:hypothetical protein